MRIEIKGLAELRRRLDAIRPAEIMEAALAAEAERLAGAVRDRLSDPPGAGAHATPWAQTGALRDSIGSTAAGLSAAVGSNDPAAALQEHGTARIPPRPFLAPTAAQEGPVIAQAIGTAVAAALGGQITQAVASSPHPAESNVSANPLINVQRRSYRTQQSVA